MAHHGQDHWTEKTQLDKQHARARRKARSILGKADRRTANLSVRSGQEDLASQRPARDRHLQGEAGF